MSLELFYSYAHEDEALRDELEKHLAVLKRIDLVVGWHDRRIGAGDEWRDQIDAHARSANIILLLVSPDFLASDYCNVEMALALGRHARHDAIVIPIILRPVDWSAVPFAHLQALPRDAKPVTTWSNRDEAFADIALGIRKIVTQFISSTDGSGPTPVAKNVPKQRVLDSASHISINPATELQVLTRVNMAKTVKFILAIGVVTFVSFLVWILSVSLGLGVAGDYFIGTVDEWGCKLPGPVEIGLNPDGTKIKDELMANVVFSQGDPLKFAVQEFYRTTKRQSSDSEVLTHVALWKFNMVLKRLPKPTVFNPVDAHIGLNWYGTKIVWSDQNGKSETCLVRH